MLLPNSRGADPAPGARSDDRAPGKPGSGFLLADLVGALRGYLVLPDTSHILFVLAVAVSNWGKGDPLWGMLIGPPGSGKTEAIRLLDGVVDASVSDVTAAGLLSYTGGKNPRVTGLLSRVGARALVTISDLSSVLARNDRGGRDLLYALLRDAYDGLVVRDLGNAPEPLVWRGHLTIAAAATPVVDRTSSHANALGARWLSHRLPESDAGSRRELARAARSRPPRIDEIRAGAQSLASSLVKGAADSLSSVGISDALESRLDEFAIVTSLGRASVGRDNKRAVLPVPEGPGRVVGQLGHLARGLAALGVAEAETLAICRKSALDSIPPERRRVLEEVVQAEGLSVAELGRRTRLHPAVVSNVLEDLEAIGVVGYHGRDESRSHKAWILEGEEAELIRRALAQDTAATDTKCGNALTRDAKVTTPPRLPVTPGVEPSDNVPGTDGKKDEKSIYPLIWSFIDDQTESGAAPVSTTVERAAAILSEGSKRSREAVVKRAINEAVETKRYRRVKGKTDWFLYRQNQLPLPEGRW